MAVELKLHNKEAYQKVIEGFKNKNRVAVVEPPGTGKSFIALKWLEENKDKKMIILVPSYSIILQYEEHIKVCGYTLSDFSNLTIMTYGTLLSEVKNGNVREVEGIILDEFHRCGAPEWGKGVETLLGKNKNAKVLGLSATPIRFLDKNRDMSDELFDGNVVFQMDLTEAVARGILHFPLYINGIYNLDADIKRYEKKINTIVDESYRKTVTEKLELAKRKLEQATKLDELFSKYMKKTNSKNIIFCKDKKHMDKMIEESYKWFSKVNPEIDIYSVYYGEKNNEEELRNFYNSNNNHLKLLFCIDMLNEGFHDPNIDNIIMLRPTISPILFIQQLGRGLALGNTEVTIYDIVNNSRSNKDIRRFIDKVKRKRKQLVEECKIEENIENFEILEEVKEVFDTLNDIESMLQSFTGKEYKICLIEEFYRINKRLPYQSEIYKEIAIGSFLRCIKIGYTKINEEQMNRLLTLGFVIEIRDRKNEKEYKVSLVEEFYRINKRLPYQKEKYKDIALGRFLYNVRRGKTIITEEQKNRLLKIGFVLEIKDKEEEKESKIKLVEEFYKINGRLPFYNEKYKEIAVGNFLRSIKIGNTKITEEQMKRLLTLGFITEVKDKEKEKEYKIQLIEEFYKINGRLPYQKEKYKEQAIGYFLSNIKNGITSITEIQQIRLENMGLQFNSFSQDILKEKKVQLVEEFYKEKGKLPNSREKYKNAFLGVFLKNIKDGITKITEDQKKRLEKLGFEKEIKVVRTGRGINWLLQFYQINKRLPKENDLYKGISLGEFLMDIESGKITITKEQKKLLEQIGINIENIRVSNDRSEEKEEKIRLIEEFYKTFGRLPKQNEKYKEVNIGYFLQGIKKEDTKITEKQMQRLEAIGFSINPQYTKISASIKKLEQFFERNGRLPEIGESLGRERPKVGDVLLEIKSGKIRITEEQLLRLQKMDTTLTREEVSLVKPKVYVKK